MSEENSTGLQQLNPKSMRKLRKRELMELVQSQNSQLLALQEKVNQMQEQLDKREIIISESGSLAEASMRLSGVFEAAQKACDQYTENAAEAARRMKADTEQECTSMRESVLQECMNLRERTWQDCVDLREKTRQDCADLREKILLACEKQLQSITVMPDISDLPVMKEIAFAEKPAGEDAAEGGEEK